MILPLTAVLFAGWFGAHALKPLPQPLVVAHRGGAALEPENTLAAFERAIALGASQIELDVHLTRDGEVVVIHDPTVDAQTDGHGRVSALTFAEVRALDAAARHPGRARTERIPTLAEVLDLAHGRIGVQIEIKTDADGSRHPGIERKVADLVAARHMWNEVMVISFDFATLREVKACDRRLRTGALVPGEWPAQRPLARLAADVREQSGADWFLPPGSAIGDSTVRAVHAAGLRIGVWTVDLPADMQRFFGMGVDAITTNRPDTLLAVLAEGRRTR